MPTKADVGCSMNQLFGAMETGHKLPVRSRLGAKRKIQSETAGCPRDESRDG